MFKETVQKIDFHHDNKLKAFFDLEDDAFVQGSYITIKLIHLCNETSG